MKKATLFVLFVILAYAPLLAQYSPCYEAAFAEGKRQYDAGKYQTAKKFFKEAKECPDSNKAAANEWIGKCDTRLRKQAEVKEKEENEAFARCTTVSACENYLKEYPKGKYVDVVTKKKWAYGHPIPRIGNWWFGDIRRDVLQKAEGLVVERDGIGYEVVGYSLKRRNQYWPLKATSAAFTKEMRAAFESDYEFMISDIQVKDADGIVRVLPDSYGLCTFDVVKNDSCVENSRKPRKVKKIVGFDENYPEPRVYVYNVHQGMVSKSALLAGNRIVLDSPVQYEVVGYTMRYKTKAGTTKEAEAIGPAFSDEIKNVISSANVGDRFYFKFIDVKGADGIVRTVVTCICVEIK